MREGGLGAGGGGGGMRRLKRKRQWGTKEGAERACGVTGLELGKSESKDGNLRGEGEGEDLQTWLFMVLRCSLEDA